MAIGAKQLLGGLVTVALLALVAPAAAAAGTPALSAHGSVQQVYVLGASPGERLSLLDRRGRVVLGAVAGPLGGAIFRGVAPGSGYSVRPAAGGSPTSPTASAGAGPSPCDTSRWLPGFTVQRPESSALSARPCSAVGRSSGCGATPRAMP